MSDKTQPTPPPSPVQKTAAVPLKKETVRITLRARPGAGLTQPKELTAPVPPPSTTSPVPRPITTSVTPAGASTGRVPTAPAPMSPVALKGTLAAISKATAPIQLPSAPLPPPAARPVTAPVQLPPGAPPAARTASVSAPPAGPSAPPRPLAPSVGGAPMAPTVPLAKAPGPPRPGAPPPRPGGGAAAMAPTVPLAKAPGPPRAPGAKVEAGASTVPLSKAPVVVAKAPGAGAPVAKAGGPTQNLPKATVQLAKSPGTQQMAGGGIVTPPSAPVKRAGEEGAALEDERDPEAGLAPLAIVCTVLAAVLMVLNLFGTDAPRFGGPGYAADPGQDHPLMVPGAPMVPWEKDNGDGTTTSTFTTTLKANTDKFE